eukprot:m.357296 g.357296  ORF g.357296 m.357296 type:complete len:91 (+) comp17777_c0_seq1:197-469(+)
MAGRLAFHRSQPLMSRLIAFPARRDAAGNPLQIISASLFPASGSAPSTAATAASATSGSSDALDETPLRFQYKGPSQEEIEMVELGGAWD